MQADQLALETAAARRLLATTAMHAPPTTRPANSSRILTEMEALKQEIDLAKNKRAQLLLARVRPSTNKRLNITTVGSIVAERGKRAKPQGIAEPVSSNVKSNILLERARAGKLGEELASYRLAGITCFSVGGRPLDLGFRFDSTFGGQLLDDKYYCILTAENNATLSLYRHSLPHFIPVNELAANFLPNDPAQFARRVARYVSSFAQRRILAWRMERDFKGQAKLVQTSQSFDIITLQGRLEARKHLPVHAVQLKFATVLDALPNQAVVTYLKRDGRVVSHEVELDTARAREELDIAALERLLDYSLWVRNVLDRNYQEEEEV